MVINIQFHGIPFVAVRCERQQHIPIRDATQFAFWRGGGL